MTKLDEAQAAFESAASRGFPENNRGQLQYDLDVARMAAADGLAQAEHAIATAQVRVDVAEAALAAAELVVETKTYPDGTEATGVAPLPELSPTAVPYPEPKRVPGTPERRAADARRKPKAK